MDGARVNPPRIAVGSNTHKVTVYDLTTNSMQTINAHAHNVPCVSFSPCGRFLATTSIDKTVKVWEQLPNGVYKLARMTVPSQDWGWAVQWIDKTECELELNAINQAGTKQGMQKMADEAIDKLVREVEGARRSGLRTGQVINMIQRAQESRDRIFRGIGTGEVNYEDELVEDEPVIRTIQEGSSQEDDDMDDNSEEVEEEE